MIDIKVTPIQVSPKVCRKSDQKKNTRFWIKKENFAMLPTVEVWTWGLNGMFFFQNRHYATIDDTRRGTTSLTTSQIWNTTTYTIISHSDFLDQNFIHEQFLMEVAAAAVTLQINHHHNKCEILGKSWWKCSSKLYTHSFER